MTPAPSLRERKQDVTRQTILEAAAAIVIEQGVQGFSVQNIADRAGVSHRTVYRYFATRQDLLDAIDRSIEEWRLQVGFPNAPAADAVPEFASAVFRRYEEHHALFLAASMLELGAAATSSMRAQRTAQGQRIFDAALPHLPAEERRRWFALLRHLLSSHTWQILRTQHRLTGDESGPAVARVIALMIGDLVRRDREAGAESEPAVPADRSQP